MAATATSATYLDHASAAPMSDVARTALQEALDVFGDR